MCAEQQGVCAVPDVTVFTRSEYDAFVVLACDGIWDVMSNQEVVDFFCNELSLCDPSQSSSVSDEDKSPPLLAGACDRLLERCLQKGSTDNMTVLVVFLSNEPASRTIAYQRHLTHVATAPTVCPPTEHQHSSASTQRLEPSTAQLPLDITEPELTETDNFTAVAATLAPMHPSIFSDSDSSRVTSPHPAQRLDFVESLPALNNDGANTEPSSSPTVVESPSPSRQASLTLYPPPATLSPSDSEIGQEVVAKRLF